MSGRRAGAAVVAAVALLLTGCGSIQPREQLAANLKAFLGATSIDQVNCGSQGFDGAGQPVRSCQVLFETAACHGSSNGAASQDSATVMVDGVQPSGLATITPGIGCSSP